MLHLKKIDGSLSVRVHTCSENKSQEKVFSFHVDYELSGFIVYVQGPGLKEPYARTL